MEKFLVTIKFNYSDAPNYKKDYTSRSKTVTLGIYEDFKEACKCGNKFLENLERKFPLHEYPDGTKARKKRFSKNGGSFGSKKTLVSNLAYIKTPFNFYAEITVLKYNEINEVINDIVSATNRYRSYNLLNP